MALGISGLSGSGLDTSKLITAIMNQEKVPLNNLTTKRKSRRLIKTSSQHSIIRHLL